MKSASVAFVGALLLVGNEASAQEPITLFDGTSLDGWNTNEIRAEGTRLQVTLNGVVTVDVEDSTHSEGPFTLQYGSGIVKFRNVQIQPLGSPGPQG